MSAADVLALERMGFRFRIDGGRVTRRCYGRPPPEAADLLARVTKADVIQFLEDRAAGFTIVTAQGWPEDATETLQDAFMAPGPSQGQPVAPEASTASPGPSVAGPVESAADKLVAKYTPMVEAAATVEDDGASACELWAEIYQAFKEIYNAGDRAAALDGYTRLETVDRNTRHKGKIKDGRNIR